MFANSALKREAACAGRVASVSKSRGIQPRLSPVEWIEHALLSGNVDLYDACEGQYQLREFVPVRYRPFVVTSSCHLDK